MHFEIFISKNLSSATAVCGVHPYLLVVKSFFKILFYFKLFDSDPLFFCYQLPFNALHVVDDTIF